MAHTRDTHVSLGWKVCVCVRRGGGFKGAKGVRVCVCVGHPRNACQRRERERVHVAGGSLSLWTFLPPNYLRTCTTTPHRERESIFFPYIPDNKRPQLRDCQIVWNDKVCREETSPQYSDIYLLVYIYLDAMLLIKGQIFSQRLVGWVSWNYILYNFIKEGDSTFGGKKKCNETTMLNFSELNIYIMLH